jgi:hypothetical protein
LLLASWLSPFKETELAGRVHGGLFSRRFGW